MYYRGRSSAPPLRQETTRVQCKGLNTPRTQRNLDKGYERKKERKERKKRTKRKKERKTVGKTAVCCPLLACCGSAGSFTLAFWKNLCFRSSDDVGLDKINERKQIVIHPSFLSSSLILHHLSDLFTPPHLFSGSFCRHSEIIFRKDLPYFLTVSLSVIPVSRDGGSFCRVSISTCKHGLTGCYRFRSNNAAVAGKRATTVFHLRERAKRELRRRAPSPIASSLTFIGGYLW